METQAAGTLRKQIKHLYEEDFMMLIGALPVQWPLSAPPDTSALQTPLRLPSEEHKEAGKTGCFHYAGWLIIKRTLSVPVKLQ